MTADHSSKQFGRKVRFSQGGAVTEKATLSGRGRDRQDGPDDKIRNTEGRAHLGRRAGRANTFPCPVTAPRELGGHCPGREGCPAASGDTSPPGILRTRPLLTRSGVDGGRGALRGGPPRTAPPRLGRRGQSRKPRPTRPFTVVQPVPSGHDREETRCWFFFNYCFIFHAYSTWASQVASHPSTDRARPCSASEIRRGRVQATL